MKSKVRGFKYLSLQHLVVALVSSKNPQEYRNGSPRRLAAQEFPTSMLACGSSSKLAGWLTKAIWLVLEINECPSRNKATDGE